MYAANCTACHSTDLRAKLTGPALGNVHLYRDMDWLIRFTQNSQAMIAAGEDLATCLWLEWGPRVVNDFEDLLSPEEIRSIYHYIANQSLLNEIDSTEVRYVLRMERDTIFDPDREPGEQQEFAMDQICYSNQDTFRIIDRSNNQGIVDSGMVIPGSSQSYIFSSDRYLEYAFDITESRWYNIDCFLQESLRGAELIEVKRLEVELANRQELDAALAVLVFAEREIVVFFDSREEGRFSLSWPAGNFQLPEEPASILVFGFAYNKVLLGQAALEIPEKLNYKITVEEVDDVKFEDFWEELE